MENETKENAESGSERTIREMKERSRLSSTFQAMRPVLAGGLYNRLMRAIAPVVAEEVEAFVLAFCETADEFLSESEGRGQ